MAKSNFPVPFEIYLNGSFRKSFGLKRYKNIVGIFSLNYIVYRNLFFNFDIILGDVLPIEHNLKFWGIHPAPPERGFNFLDLALYSGANEKQN